MVSGYRGVPYLDNSKVRACCAGSRCGKGLCGISCVSILSTVAYSLNMLIGCFGFNGPLRQYFIPYLAVSQRGRKIRKR